MREDLKRKLDESVPEDVTLSDAKKRQILKAAQQRKSGRKPSRVPKMLPALVGVAVIGVSGILGAPYVSDWQEQRGAVVKKELEPQEMIVEGREYPVLIPSIYDDHSGDLLYEDNNNLYVYNSAADTETLLVNTSEGLKISNYDIDGKWLAWGEYGEEVSNLKIMDRETDQVETFEDVYLIDLQIEGNELVFGSIGGGEKPQYLSVDLKTMDTKIVHEMAGDGAMSGASIEDSKLVVPELAEEEGETVTNFYVYNLEDNSLLNKFTLPYPTASGVSINNNRIYAQFGNETMEQSILGYVDIQTGKFTEISTPGFHEFAVHDDYLALSESDESDFSDLRLYQMSGTQLKKVPAFSGIEERLVRPRFTDEGTLVVNGEAEDRAMYLLDVTK